MVVARPGRARSGRPRCRRPIRRRRCPSRSSGGGSGRRAGRASRLRRRSRRPPRRRPRRRSDASTKSVLRVGPEGAVDVLQVGRQRVPGAWARPVDAPHLLDRPVPELRRRDAERVVVHPLAEHDDRAAARGAVDPVVRLRDVRLDARAEVVLADRRVDLGREVPGEQPDRDRDGSRCGDARHAALGAACREVRAAAVATIVTTTSTFSIRSSGHAHSRFASARIDRPCAS